MEERCHVCGDELDEQNVSGCVVCHRRFHMPWTTLEELPKCGEVYLDELSCTMRFICRECIGNPPPAEEMDEEGLF